MLTYKATFRMKSASASLWQADMIFGHLCWDMVRRKGEAVLLDFLKKYQEGNPVILVSDGFPSEFLVRPFFLMRDQDSEDLPKADRLSRHRDIKDVIRSTWMTIEDFLSAAKGERNFSNEQPDLNIRVVSKNKIDRMVNTAGVGSGELFDFTEFCTESFDVYWRISDDYLDHVQDFLKDLIKTGYGKRKSVGYGQIGSYKFEKFEKFQPLETSNGFVTLSNFVPSEYDPIDGYWQKSVKYGKLGEEGALIQNPFKNPLVQIQAGSCFYDSSLRTLYGRMIEGLAVDWPSVHYGFAFPVEMVLPDKGERHDG